MLQEHVLDLEMGEKMEAMRLLWLTDLGPIFNLHYILELYPCKMTWFLEPKWEACFSGTGAI